VVLGGAHDVADAGGLPTVAGEQRPDAEVISIPAEPRRWRTLTSAPIRPGGTE
jgi:hypothetical protein